MAKDKPTRERIDHLEEQLENFELYAIKLEGDNDAMERTVKIAEALIEAIEKQDYIDKTSVPITEQKFREILAEALPKQVFLPPEIETTTIRVPVEACIKTDRTGLRKKWWRRAKGKKFLSEEEIVEMGLKYGGVVEI